MKEWRKLIQENVKWFWVRVIEDDRNELAEVSECGQAFSNGGGHELHIYNPNKMLVTSTNWVPTRLVGGPPNHRSWITRGPLMRIDNDL